MNFYKDLTEKILPFWLNNAIDEKYGGIFTCLDEEGRIYGRDKSVWFQGRALWSFAKAYNIIEKNPKYLDACRKIYDFLPKCTDTDGRMFFSVTEDGRELQKRRYYFSETFAAIGCAEYYKATGDAKVLEKAKEYFDVSYECFSGIRKNTPKLRNTDLTALSPVMIMLSTAQVMRSVSNDEKYDKVCRACLDKIINGGFLTDKALLENVKTDGSFENSPTGRIVNPGHSLEAAWFIMAESVMTNNREVLNSAKKIIDLSWEIGWDKKYGGIVAFADVDRLPPVQLEHDMKLWWPQCEAMIALRMAYIIFGEEVYKNRYEMVEEYCEKYFADNVNGEWYGYLHYDNTVSNTLKGNLFKGPFHIPRMYMIMSVIEKTGNINEYIM